MHIDIRRSLTIIPSCYEKFLDKENFELAYTRLKTANRNEYKEFYYNDFRVFECFFDQNIEQLLSDIQEGIYEPTNCEKYYMPKKKNLARPITLLCLIDQIVYQAIANVIADDLHPIMSKYFNINSFGNVFLPSTFENSIYFYEKWKNQWKRFNDQKKSSFSEGFEYSAEFDIASFYDTIDHSILIEILNEYSINEKLIQLLEKCLKKWTTSPTAFFRFQKSCGIPQGPLCSSFFSEIYLFKLDNEMRKQTNIKYFRYADDISIMAKNEQECRKMIAYLDLLARDLSLIPQPEKIGVSHIVNINDHINNISSKFSTIAREYKIRKGSLKARTHNKLKKQVLSCLFSNDVDKTLIRFALYKLNKDNDIKNALIINIKKLELFYNEVIFYFNKHYPKDSDFENHIKTYLLGETVLFQYNKSVLFKEYEYLDFDENLFRSNFRSTQRYWIVQYHLVNWLKRCKKYQLISECNLACNYYIKREINYVKFSTLTDDCTKQIFLEGLIADSNPMISLQGLYLWMNSFFPTPKVDVNNNYAKRSLNGAGENYFEYIMKSFYKLEVPNKFSLLCKSDENIYIEIKDDIKDFINNRNINSNVSLMALDLFHNIIFDILADDIGYTKGEFGASIDQMQILFPLACKGFKLIHEMRNQKSLAHYKDKNGVPRIRITHSEYNELLDQINLEEIYSEIFAHYQ